MILYPAIDLKDGACVRLRRGDMADATVYNRDPAAQARAFAAAGFAWLHVVDLDGAVAGAARNQPAVRAILAAAKLPVQLGGGIRDLEAIEGWLAAGVARVILGTAAVERPALVAEASRRHPGRIAVGIDARAGRIATRGWTHTTGTRAIDLARKLADAGAAAFIYTDIERDGVLAGPNLDATAALAEAVETPVIASGGVGSLADLRALAALESVGVAGVICGRALYDGRIEPGAALAAMAGEWAGC